MKKLLYQIDTDLHPAVFDNVVAYDGGADHVIGYGGVTPDNVGPLVDGATKAFRMGVDDLNKAGGLLGRKIEVIERDTKSQPAEGAKEVRDLIVNH